MGMHCCCGVKKRDNGWECACDWNGWFLCFEHENVPKNVPIKKHPEIDGEYNVRVFEDGSDHEAISKFCTEEKNWGQYTNEAISKWEIEYDDNWMGYRGVYAWKPIK